MTLNCGNYRIFLTMGNAGNIPSAVGLEMASMVFGLKSLKL